MIFNCGASHDDKIERLKNWHDFTPWWPRRVVVNGRNVCVAFEIIERKGQLFKSMDDDWWMWEYRMKERSK